jgi:hypothetical protein
MEATPNKPEGEEEMNNKKASRDVFTGFFYGNGINYLTDN